MPDMTFLFYLLYREKVTVQCIIIMFYKLTTNVDLILDLTLHITLPTGQVDCMSDPSLDSSPLESRLV